MFCYCFESMGVIFGHLKAEEEAGSTSNISSFMTLLCSRQGDRRLMLTVSLVLHRFFRIYSTVSGLLGRLLNVEPRVALMFFDTDSVKTDLITPIH